MDIQRVRRTILEQLDELMQSTQLDDAELRAAAMGRSSSGQGAPSKLAAHPGATDVLLRLHWLTTVHPSSWDWRYLVAAPLLAQRFFEAGGSYRELVQCLAAADTSPPEYQVHWATFPEPADILAAEGDQLAVMVQRAAESLLEQEDILQRAMDEGPALADSLDDALPHPSRDGAAG